MRHWWLGWLALFGLLFGAQYALSWPVPSGQHGASTGPPPPPVPVITVTPNSPTIPDTTGLGVSIATYSVIMSNGQPFVGTTTFGPPNNDDSATFTLSGTPQSGNILTNPAGPAVGPNTQTIVDNITLLATVGAQPPPPNTPQPPAMAVLAGFTTLALNSDWTVQMPKGWLGQCPNDADGSNLNTPYADDHGHTWWLNLWWFNLSNNCNVGQVQDPVFGGLTLDIPWVVNTNNFAYGQGYAIQSASLDYPGPNSYGQSNDFPYNAVLEVTMRMTPIEPASFGAFNTWVPDAIANSNNAGIENDVIEQDTGRLGNSDAAVHNWNEGPNGPGSSFIWQQAPPIDPTQYNTYDTLTTYDGTPKGMWFCSYVNGVLQQTSGSVPTGQPCRSINDVTTSSGGPPGGGLVTTSNMGQRQFLILQNFCNSWDYNQQVAGGACNFRDGETQHMYVKSVRVWSCATWQTTQCLRPVISDGTLAQLDPTKNILPAYNDAYPNWKMAGLQSIGGIPNRTTNCATLTPLGGGMNDVPQIQAAVDACPAGGVVQLGAGTFSFSTVGATPTTININKGVTLRGCTATPCTSSQETDNCNASSGTTANGIAGPGANLTGSPYCRTVINAVGGAQVGTNGCTGAGCVIQVAVRLGSYPGWNTPTTLTADAAQGDTSITVASANGFSVGQWTLIDELSASAYQTDPLLGVPGGGTYPAGEQVWAASDWPNTSGAPATGKVAWQKHNPPVSGDDFGASDFPTDSGSVGCFFSFCDRTTSELHRISGVSGNTITFDSPLTVAYRQSGGHNAQLYSPQAPFTQQAGVENLTIQGSSAGGVVFQFCAYCWMRGVEVETWLNGGTVSNYAARGEINHNFIHHAAYPLPGGAEYAIDFTNADTEMYVVDNISMLAGKPIVARAAGAGSVVAYNYMDDILIGFTPTWQEVGANGSHTAGSHMMLFEGNWAHNIDNDSTHGSEVYHTFFRNYAAGLRTPFFDYWPGEGITQSDLGDGSGSGGGPLRAVGNQYYNYWMAYVGNVLGTSGVTTAANAWPFTDTFPCGKCGIYMEGWRDVAPQAVDPNVAIRSFKHGNYDYFNNAISWDANTPNHTLPNSFYLAAQPSFFTNGASTWPWVNPTGSPQLFTNPAKARHDAGTPFVQP